MIKAAEQATQGHRSREALVVLRLRKLGRQFLQLQSVKLDDLLTLVKLRDPCSQFLVEFVNSLFRLSAGRQVLVHLRESVQVPRVAERIFVHFADYASPNSLQTAYKDLVSKIKLAAANLPAK